MKTHILLLIVGLGLAYTLMKTVHTPEHMITPGMTIYAHSEIATDCFACHTPFLGATPEKCIDCHKVDEIGLRTTKGEPIVGEKKVRFHQQLIESDCVACHSDHKGVQPFRPINRFSHSLLDKDLQKQCDGCHDKPKDKLHRKFEAECSQCHTQDKWREATFSHKTLKPEVLEQCDSCHEVPRDDKHRKFKTISCASCHGNEAWEPALFEHKKLPAAELKQCLNCHEKPDDKRHRKFKENCNSCHGYKDWEAVDFKHEKLSPAELAQCLACHSKPDDKRHRKFKENCDSCHGYKEWDEVDFKHSKLPPAELKQCQSCHESPRDSLHRSTKLSCGECHSQEAWEPATFKHDKYFRFDRHHRDDCDTCHENGDYSKYTCYSCHEHSPRRIRGEHLEEGIRDFENCVECHRSGNEHEAEHIWRQKRYEQRSDGNSTFYSREREWGEHEYEDDDD